MKPVGPFGGDKKPDTGGGGKEPDAGGE